MPYDFNNNNSIIAYLIAEFNMKPVMYVKDVQSMFRISRATVENDIRSGILKPYNTGKRKCQRRFFTQNEILNYVKSNPKRLEKYETEINDKYIEQIKSIARSNFYRFTQWYGLDDMVNDAIIKLSGKKINDGNSYTVIRNTLMDIFRKNRRQFEIFCLSGEYVEN